MSMNEVVKKLSQAIDKQADKAKTTAYDTPATVRRIEGDTAWVHIPGGVDETPVKLTISAKEGDQVQVRVSGGSAFMVGNGTNPPTDDTRANSAYSLASIADGAAQNALGNATLAKEAADSAQASASAAESAAGDAVIAAGDAQTAAGNAQQSADSALVNLSTVQDVVGVLNWITAHGTMTSQAGGTYDASKVYFIVDQNGDYVVNNVHYSVVSEPDPADIDDYYVLTVDESVQNYVATHIVVDSEGLWIVPDAGGNKVLIAVGGAGHTYSTAGTYIIGKVNNVDTVLAKFTANGAYFYKDNNACAQFGIVTKIGRQHVANSTSSEFNENYITMERWSTDYSSYTYFRAIHDINNGNDYVVMGSAEGTYPGYGYQSLTVGDHTDGRGARGAISVAIGEETDANGQCSFAAGEYTSAGGWGAVSQNNHTIAQRKSQTAIGEYNIADTAGADGTVRGDYALIIGNGTAENARSNALTVDWDGGVDTGALTESSGTYSGGLNDEALLTTATITKWQTILGI